MRAFAIGVGSMASRLRLVEAQAALAGAYCKALREGFQRGIQPVASEAHIQEIERDPGQWLRDITSPDGMITLRDGRKVKKVPATLFWLMHDDAFVGELSFRHELNELLGQSGGHIGYGIHTDWQGQGHGKTMLRLALEHAPKLGLKRVFITASADNIASWKIIEACGGVLQDEVEDHVLHEGKLIRRYWIEIEEFASR